jgi:phosphatidylserine decarboxylase
MSHEIIYRERASASLKVEDVYAGSFLWWVYNSRIGRLMESLFLRHKVLSRVYGWFYSTAWSKRFIEPFVRRMKVDMSDHLKSIREFQSFNDFFTREINLSRRSIESDPTLCLAPVDGKVLAHQEVDGDTEFHVKRHTFHLRSFLRDESLAHRFSGGALVICRLSLRDYHHVHFPDSGVPGTPRTINGVLHAGGPYALSHFVSFYEENQRVITLLESDHFGVIGIVEVGAFTVGSIRQGFQPFRRVARGGHKGWFELGGSTVVLLFEKGRIVLDEDLCRATDRGIETFVPFGQSIGKPVEL